MTFIVSFLVFDIGYTILYLIPFAGLVFLLSLMFPTPLPTAVPAIVGVVGFGLLFAVGHRARIAAQCYGDRDMTLWEAHLASWAISRAELAFLPFVGKHLGGKHDRGR